MKSNLGKRVFKHGLVLTTTILTCGALQAKDNDQTSTAAERFVHKAIMGGQMEVQMGTLAQQKGQSQDVKSLGATLIRDHTQANQRLQQLASTKNITVSQADLSSSTVSTTDSSTSTRASSAAADHTTSAHATADETKHAKAQREMAKLQTQSGQEFDKAFVRMAIKDHKKDISEFERARTEVNDPELKGFIDQTLPTLRQHLQLAQTAAKSVGVDASSIAADREDDSSDSAVGGAASGTTGTRGSDKPSSPASDKDRSSIDRSDRLNGATDAAAGGTIIHNNPRADLDANVGDHSVSASAGADTADHTASASTDTKNKVFQKGDGKVLGLSTDKNDGKFLGIIPDPKKRNEANVNADVNVNGHEASVGSSAATESGSSQSK